MDISEIRALSDADLAQALTDAKQELWKIRFDLATRQEKISKVTGDIYKGKNKAN